MLDFSSEPGTFDCVVAFHSIFHTDYKGLKAVCDSITNCLKNEGRLYVTFNSKNNASYSNPLNKRIDDYTAIKTQGFEEGILKELALAFPQYDGWIASICSRFIDLLIPFRQFHYYHPGQKGSASLKSVLPALTSKGYEGLAIADGMSASIIFQQVTYGDISPETGVKVRADLEKYCGLDTEGMIFIVDELRALCR